MITKDKLHIYQSFGGDGDLFSRACSNSQKSRIEDGDWSRIDSMFQDCILIQKGLASKEYIERVTQKINEECDSSETIQELFEMAKI